MNSTQKQGYVQTHSTHLLIQLIVMVGLYFSMEEAKVLDFPTNIISIGIVCLCLLLILSPSPQLWDGPVQAVLGVIVAALVGWFIRDTVELFVVLLVFFFVFAVMFTGLSKLFEVLSRLHA